MKSKTDKGAGLMSVATHPETEEQAIERWRGEQFRGILPGIDENIIAMLVVSDVSPHDLAKLLDNGCDPELAVKILV